MNRHPIVSRLLLCSALSSTFACDVDEPTEEELRSSSSVPAMRLVLDQPSTGTRLVRTVTGEDPPSTVEVRFEPLSPTEQLVGEPTAWCNSPSAGQPLVCDVPVPAAPGDPDTDEDLIVRSPASSGSTIRIPITIKHGV